jgi:hypothetical protein
MIPMKAVKMSDQLHAELTGIVGELIAESGQMKTYEDAIEAMVHRSVVLPPEFVQEIKAFIEDNREFGFLTIEEFLKTAGRWLMNHLKKEISGLAIFQQSQNMRSIEFGKPKAYWRLEPK